MNSLPRYDGSFFLHSRTICEAAQIATLRSRKTRTKLTLTQLESFLSFLSLYSLSHNFRFDASIPAQYKEETMQASELLGIEVSARNYPEDSFDADILDSMRAAGALLQASMRRKTLPAVLSVKDSKRINQFWKAIHSMHNERNELNRQDIARKAYYKYNLMGAKALIGLSSEDMQPVLSLLHARMQTAPSSRGFLMGLVIEHFRSFFLSRWAARERAIYATHRFGNGLLSRYRNHIWPKVERSLRDLAKGTRAKLPVAPPISESGSVYLPLIGIAVLHQARPDDWPKDLIHRASRISRTFKLDQLHKKLVNLQYSYDGGTDIDEIVAELWDGVRSVREPHWKLKALKRAAVDIVPDLTTLVATEILKNPQTNLDLLKKILVFRSATRLLWALVRVEVDKKHFISLDRLIALDSPDMKQVALERVRSIWKTDLSIR